MPNLSATFSVTGTQIMQSALSILSKMLDDDEVPQKYKDEIKALVESITQ